MHIMAKETLRHQKNPETKFKICLTPSPHAPPPGSEPRWCAGNMVPNLAILIFFNDFFYEDI